MRLLPSLAAAALVLIALPLAPTGAEAATTPCGFLNGQFDASGKRYSGTITWPGDPYDLDGDTADKVFPIEATLAADCKASWTAGGSTQTGKWLQKNDNMVIEVGALQMLIKVAPDGSLKGEAINDEDSVGKVALKLR